MKIIIIIKENQDDDEEEKSRTNINAHGFILSHYMQNIQHYFVHATQCKQAKKINVRKRDCDEGKEEMMKNKNNNTKTERGRETYTQIRLLNDDRKHSKRAQEKENEKEKYFVEATHWRQEACVCARCEWD